MTTDTPGALCCAVLCTTHCCALCRTVHPAALVLRCVTPACADTLCTLVAAHDLPSPTLMPRPQHASCPPVHAESPSHMRSMHRTAHWHSMSGLAACARLDSVRWAFYHACLQMRTTLSTAKPTQEPEAAQQLASRSRVLLQSSNSLSPVTRVCVVQRPLLLALAQAGDSSGTRKSARCFCRLHTQSSVSASIQKAC